MTESPEPRKPAHTTDTSDTEFFERLQRLNNTYGNGHPVTPPPHRRGCIHLSTGTPH